MAGLEKLAPPRGRRRRETERHALVSGRNFGNSAYRVRVSGSETWGVVCAPRVRRSDHATLALDGNGIVDSVVAVAAGAGRGVEEGVPDRRTGGIAGGDLRRQHSRRYLGPEEHRGAGDL